MLIHCRFSIPFRKTPSISKWSNSLFPLFRRRLYSLKSQSSDEFYVQNRQQELQQFEKTKGISIYPSNFKKASLSFEEFKQKFLHLQPKEKSIGEVQVLHGRIKSKRISSRKLTFFTLEDSNGSCIQIMASESNFVSLATGGSDTPSDFSVVELIRPGDIINVEGFPGVTGTGELSLFSQKIQLLSPCLRPIPMQFSDLESRSRKRHLDLLVNASTKKIFQTRSKIMQQTRRFFDDRGFMEVETPILSAKSGGALARPFETHLNALDMHLKMRIAPELYLKVSQ